MYIPYGKQSMDEADIQAVIEVLKSDFLTTGPKIKEFEQAVAEYTGAEYADRSGSMRLQFPTVRRRCTRHVLLPGSVRGMK